MHSNAKKLLELHVQHELKNFSDAQFQADLSLELAEFWKQLSNTKLHDFIQTEQVIVWAQANVLNVKLHVGVGKLIHKLIADLYADPSHTENGLNALISREQVEAFIDKGLTQTQLRKELIHQGMSNEITHEVITELLYSGISSYLTESNVVSQNAQKVPGAKAMMKMGKGLMNKAAPKLEEKIESQVKKYIGTALPDVIAQSESFIHDSITDAHIKEIAMGIWSSAENLAISNARDYISEADAQDYAELCYQQFLSSRKADYVNELVTTGINSFFDCYGNKKLDSLCKDFSINADSLERATMLFAPQILQVLRDSGYLEQRIRARLERFYNSESAQTVFS